MVNLQARLHSGEKLRRQQEKQIAVPMTILHGMEKVSARNALNKISQMQAAF